MNIHYLERAGQPRLAYVYSPPGRGGNDLSPVMFLGGYRSDMSGAKATYFEAQCRARGQAYLRFDYSGHGASDGAFEDGTIGSWKDDALAVLDHVAKGPVILVGSSMGGWIALLAARERPEMVRGLIGIAAAPDFTEEIYGRLTPAQKETLMNTGRVEVPNDYSDKPYVYTLSFYEEAKAHLLLKKGLKTGYPVRLIQGRQDKDVPWQTALAIQKAFPKTADVGIVFVKDGDHRLSREQDLELIDRKIQEISAGGR